MAGEEPTTLRDQLEDAVDQTIPDPTPEVNAPETWTDEDKTYFNGIQDPKARQWLVDRDTNYSRQLTETQEKYKGFDDIFAPYDDRLKTAGQTRQQVVTNLLSAQNILETNPVEGLRQLVQMFKIAPETVMQALNMKAAAPASGEQDPAEDPYADLNPALAQQLRAMDEGMKQLLDTHQQAQEQHIAQVRSNLVTKATEFRETKDASGQPAYPHMSDKRVVDKMSLLLKTGVVKVEGGDVTAAYKNAYDQAIYSFPDIREKLTATLNQDRVRRARQAGVSPRNTASASRVTPKVGNSVRDQLEAAFNTDAS